ncbi:ParA family protein [Zooshikella ganghwensis]|uniref:ParA family protein n=1 Tax=Zooshikella ganghwensis TaxID=202772 RepID=UPI000480F0A8|nr:ParA family protein [Zooshikella ganghwensis]
MRIWTISNQKGGVGKTTTVVALGGLLAQQNYRVLLLDLDPHASLTCYFKYDPDQLEHSLFDLFSHQGKVPDYLPGQLVVDTGFHNLMLLPATTSLAVLDRQITNQGGYGLVISRALIHLWDQFDYALLDTPPQLGVLMVNALAASQRLLLPVQTEFLALKGLERMLHTMRMVCQSQKKALPFLVIPTLFDRRTQASVQSLLALRKQHMDHIWQSYIPVDTRLRDASQAGIPPSVFDKNSRSVKAYGHLLKDLLAMHQRATPLRTQAK